MSLRTLSTIAVQRDQPRETPVLPPATAGPWATGETVRAADAGGGTAVSSATDVLIHAIPGEVLAPYTALVGIVVSRATAKHSYLALRWSMFAVALAMVAVYLGVTFYRNRPPTGRKFPLVEVVAAVVAFGAWGLAMPSSPLSVKLSNDSLTIATAIISVSGAFVIGLIAPTLAKPSAKAP